MTQKNQPNLIPAIMKAPKYGTNYRQSSVISQQKDAEAHQAMLSGKPLTSNHLVSQNGESISNSNSGDGHVIPNIQTGVTPSHMAHSALTGTANTTLQIQENSKYDEFDPNKPISSNGNELKSGIEGFSLIHNNLEREIIDNIKHGNIRVNKHIIGIIAVITGIISFIPILMRMRTTHNATNFTWLNLGLALISNVAWFLYGYLTKSNTNIVSGILYFIIYSYIVSIKFVN
jgi:uncharacterized protein with PQ loop repeat